MSIIYLIALAQSAGVAPQAPLGPLPVPPPVQRDIAPLPAPPSVPTGRPATPIGNPGNWILTDDYPAIALRQSWTGITAFRLTIGLSGYVVGCDITRTSGYAVLDQTTCTLITQRASFRPARDAQGKPVVGYYSSRVRWELPTLENPFAAPDGTFSPVAITWRFFIEPDGSTSDCVVTDGNTMMQVAETGSPCDPDFHYKPFTDANGKPVRKRVFYRMESGPEPVSTR